MPKRKNIELRYGAIQKLADMCGVSRMTVWKALRWNTDSDIQNKIRQTAKEQGFIKRF